MGPGDRLDALVVCHLAEEVDRHHGGHPAALVRRQIEGRLEQVGVHVAGLIAVDEDRLGAGVDDGVGGRGERHGRGEHHIAGACPQHQQPEVQGRGARRQGDRVLPVAVVGQFSLEGVHLGPQRCDPAALHRTQNRLLLQPGDVGRGEKDTLSHDSRPDDEQPRPPHSAQ